MLHASADIFHRPLNDPANEKFPYGQAMQHTQEATGLTGLQNRLGLNLPTDTSIEVSVLLLLQSYRKKYPTDPVTEQDFGKLIQHPKTSETENLNTMATTESAHARSQGHPATQQASTMDQQDDHEMMDEREGSPEANPTNIFTEFVNGWRNLRPNGAVLNDTAGGRPQRKLDVLSWGFGE